jgi:ketosteroid isomerase-like protein
MEKKLHQADISAIGEQLERLSIQYIQDKNWDALNQMLDPACQFVGMNGSYDRSSAMTLMKQMNLGPVQFRDFQVTQSGANLIVSFWLAAIEYQDGKPLSPNYSPRLSVWKRTDERWLCIAYADLISAALQ